MEDSLYIHALDMDMYGNPLAPNISPSNQVEFNKYNYSSFTYSLDMRFEILERNILAIYFGQSDYLDIDLQSFYKFLRCFNYQDVILLKSIV